MLPFRGQREREHVASGRLVVQPKRAYRSLDADPMVAIAATAVPARLSAVVISSLVAEVTSALAAVDASAAVTVNASASVAVGRTIRAVVMRRTVLGLSMRCLMIQVAMKGGMLVARLRSMMGIVVDDITVSSMVGKICMVVGM